MTIHEPRTDKARLVGRFVRHYLEMVIAMLLGMLLLGLVWSAVLPQDTRFDVDTLIMAADMTIGMGVWMRLRRHGWPSIAEMSLAMILPFLILLVRTAEYTDHQHRLQVRTDLRPPLDGRG